jgi:hypothetical protein
MTEHTEKAELHGSKTDHGLKSSVPSVISVCSVISLLLSRVADLRPLI